MSGIHEKVMSDDAQDVDHTTGIGRKVCTICGEIKPLDEFHRDKSYKDGYRSNCKICTLRQIKMYRAANPEKHREDVRQWQLANPEKHRESARQWRVANPGKAKESVRRYKAGNLEKVRESTRRWQVANPEKHRKNRRSANKKRCSTPRGKLNNTISTSMRRSLTGSKAGRHWESLVSYTVNDLKKHLEKKFQPGMTWNNYGEWHLDHRVPISVFNFETPEDIDFKKCWALKNLQPMWAIENIKKSNKLGKPFQPSFSFKGPIKVD